MRRSRAYQKAYKAKRYAEELAERDVWERENGREHPKNARRRQIEANKLAPLRRDFITYVLSVRRLCRISFARYLAILEQQNYRCAICKTTKFGSKHNRPCVDHDHITNRVRGLLCKKCNSFIGYLGDDYLNAREKSKDILAYLKAHRGES